jgi:Transposase DNA-binding
MIKKPKTDEVAWSDRELANDGFQDVRLRRRIRTLLKQLWTSMGQTIPFAFQDWATKGAYVFCPMSL